MNLEVRAHTAPTRKVRPYILECKLKKILKKQDKLESLESRVMELSEKQLEYLVNLPEDQVYEALKKNNFPKKHGKKSKKKKDEINPQK